MEWTLSHDAIKLNYANENSEVVRSIQVVEMRRTTHDQTVYRMEIAQEGIITHRCPRVKLSRLWQA